jgi:hypothetical protein
MHYGFHITRLTSDRWKLELKYQHGSFSEVFKTFRGALETGQEYVLEDEQHSRGEFEGALVEILGEILEDRR